MHIFTESIDLMLFSVVSTVVRPIGISDVILLFWTKLPKLTAHFSIYFALPAKAPLMTALVINQ